MTKLKYWDDDGPDNPGIYLEWIDHFNAQGKRRVYGRGEIFPFSYGQTDFNMTIWRDRDRKMFVRFWSSDDDIDWRAFTIIGMLDTDISGSKMSGDWIPYCLRSAYDEWITDEW